MQRTILITGATSGIGRACAISFARLGDRLILTGRRNERLLSLAGNLKNDYETDSLTLCFDIRNKDEVAAALNNLPDEWKTIDVLINNAGLASGLNQIQDGDLQDWETMIDTNIKGLLYVSRMIMPLMIERKSGHIINIGSIAGKEAYPKGNVYCATKFAVDALTRSMRIDLLSHGIKVSQIAPGAVETEFSEVRFKGDLQKAADVYKGFTPLSGMDIASAAVWIAGLPPHVNINDLVIMPTAQAGPMHLQKNI